MAAACSDPGCQLPAMGFWMDYQSGSPTDYCPVHFCEFALALMRAMEEAQMTAEGAEQVSEEQGTAELRAAHQSRRRRPRVVAMGDDGGPVVEDAPAANGEAGA